MVTLYSNSNCDLHILPSFTPTGKGGICFSSNFYCRVRDEDHSVRVVATPDRVPPECLEPLRFYNCHDRVSDAAVCTRAGLEAKLQGFHIIMKNQCNDCFEGWCFLRYLTKLYFQSLLFMLASFPQRGTSHDVLPQHRGGRREGAEGLQGAQTAPPSLRRAKWVLSLC